MCLVRTLHAMHRTGKFTKELVSNLVSKIFAAYPKEQLIGLFGDVNFPLGKSNSFPENRCLIVKEILRENIKALSQEKEEELTNASAINDMNALI